MESINDSAIYLDHNATTPVAPEVLNAMRPYLAAEFGNPSSAYALGQRARQALEKARSHVAAMLGCDPAEITFTSGGSEGNNHVVKGICDFRRPAAGHLITTAVEHPAVLNPAFFLMELGAEVTILPVDRFGRVDPAAVAEAIQPHTRLISVMLANNETGTLQPVRQIADLARRHGIPVHTDAAQAVGKIPVDVQDLGVDFLTLAGHKLYAPKGIGALYQRPGRTLTPLIHGGGQEDGRRSGTENVALAVALGAAARVARERLEADRVRLARLRDHLAELLFGAIAGLVLNGHPTERLPNTLNVAVPGLEGRRILEAMPGLMASTGAACHGPDIRLSYVLAAMGVPPHVGMGALRLSLGRGNTRTEMDTAARLIIQQVERMRHA